MRKILTSIMVMGVLACLPAPQLSAAESEPAPSCFAVGRNAICINEQSYTADVCAAIAAYSDHWSLPEAFFARLIWQESRFDPYAISPAGAQGIAQFMPGTARLRQLSDMFDPAEALARSAEYLRELELKYGNLGLAAAAYNAGEGRVSRVVNSGAGVPSETRNFVSIITGRGIDYWLNEEAQPLDYALHPETGFIDACIDMANSVPMPDFGPEPAGWQPWGILIAQNFSRDLATQRFERAQANYSDVLGAEPLMLISVRNANFGPRTRFSAMVGRPTRQDAQALCDSLLAIGGQCIVQRNRE